MPHKKNLPDRQVILIRSGSHGDYQFNGALLAFHQTFSNIQINVNEAVIQFIARAG